MSLLKKNLFIILVILTTYYLIFNTSLASAQSMSNSNYIINVGDLNTVSNTTANTGDKLKSEVKQTNPVITEGVNFKVRSGFANTPTLPFSATLSSDVIDFGLLTPTNPIIRTVDLTINSLSTLGYSVLVFENNSLKNTLSTSEDFIPDTTCDNGQCSQESSSAWTNALTYGFGYRCDNVNGADCDNSFLSPNFYKHFANISNSENPQFIMQGIGSENTTGRLSYKINISGNQAQGIYSNKITYIAVPNF